MAFHIVRISARGQLSAQRSEPFASVEDALKAIEKKPPRANTSSSLAIVELSTFVEVTFSVTPVKAPAKGE